MLPGGVLGASGPERLTHWRPMGPRFPRALLPGLVALALVACDGRSAAPTTTINPNAGACGGGRAGPPPNYAHVVWIWMENHTYGQVIDSPSAPYETTLAHQCGTATHYSAVGIPSLPNYLAATSGGTWGVADDAEPPAHPLTVDNLFRQVMAAGRTERSYQEGMPGPCDLGASGSYAVKHNPAAYYVGAEDRAACRADDVPLGSLDAGPLVDDLAADTLPAFSFVTPDLCHDTHDCPVAAGDSWLALWVPKILASPAYRSGTTAVFIVWDEPTPMPNIVVSPSTPPKTTATEAFDHYSLLRTTEELLGLPLLGDAAGASSMRAAFHL